MVMRSLTHELQSRHCSDSSYHSTVPRRTSNSDQRMTGVLRRWGQPDASADLCRGAGLNGEILARFSLQLQTAVSTLSLCGLAAMFCAGARAEPIGLTCTHHDVGTPTPTVAMPAPGNMMLSYDGDADGTLTVKGPFGAMSLPANKQTREGAVSGVNDGKPYSIIGIRAKRPASLLMPDRAAIERCIAAELKPEEVKDADLAFMATMSCTAATKPGASAVPVVTSVEIALMSTAPGQLEVLTVYIKRTFAEPRSLPEGKITVASDPRCEIKRMQASI